MKSRQLLLVELGRKANIFMCVWVASQVAFFQSSAHPNLIRTSPPFLHASSFLWSFMKTYSAGGGHGGRHGGGVVGVTDDLLRHRVLLLYENFDINTSLEL